MNKTILLTGGTDGIGLKTAEKLLAKGHTLLLHGRSENKLQNVKQALVQTTLFVADLSDLSEVVKFAENVKRKFSHIDTLINNAGVFKVPDTKNADGLDVRFVVNTLAPYLLTNRLLPVMGHSSRVINLSSAAQARVDLSALNGALTLADGEAYAKSKLAITMWSFHLAQCLGDKGPVVIAVNPASFLGSKMVKAAYGSQGKDVNIGADVLVSASLDDKFSKATGRYFDNDIGVFADPHPDALNNHMNDALINEMKSILQGLGIEFNIES